MKFVTIMMKGMKETVRDKRGFAMLLLLPAIFMVVFGYAFGAGSGGNTPHDIVVLNEDEGTTLSYIGEGGSTNFGENFTKILTNLNYDNSSTHMFIVHNQTREESLNSLMKREIALIVTIPPNFSKSMEALINFTIRDEVTKRIGQSIIERIDDKNSVDSYLEQMTLPVVSSIKSTVEIEGDSGYMEFGTSLPIVQAILMSYETDIRQKVVENTVQNFPEQLKPESQSGGGHFLEISIVSVSGTEQFTSFDFQAPGIMIFALLLLAVGSAGYLARESEKQTLSRLKISLMSSFDLLLGTLTIWSSIALVQVSILFGTAVLLGFHWTGGVSTIFVAVLIGVIAGIASVALGLILASFAKSESQASSIANLVAIPLSFLMGAFFPIEAGGLIQIMPWGQAVIALRSLLTFGNPISDVIVNIELMILQTIILFSIGVFLFSRSRLKAE